MKIECRSFAENQLRGAEFEFAHWPNKVGQPVNRTEWF